MVEVRRDAVLALFGLFLGLIGVAWALALPPGAGPDEPAHYIKALGVGGGDLYGRSTAPTEAQVRALIEASRSSEQRARIEALISGGLTPGARWQQRTSRTFTVPAGLSFSAFGCGYWREGGWTCLDEGRTSPTATDRETYVGTYQPYVYAAPGLAMRVADEPQAALRIGRLVNAVLSLGLLAAAAVVLWDGSRGARSLVGLIVAVTPAVVFWASILNPSGPELTAAICFTACLLRLTRTADSPRGVWLVCACSGVVLALSRSLGPGFVALLVLGVVGLGGWRRAVATVRRAPRPSAATAATLGIACAAGVFWERRYQPHLPWGPGAIRDGLDEAVDTLPDLPKQAVGVFGGTDIYMPLAFYVVWWLMLAGLLLAALSVGSALDRASLAVLAVAVVAATIVLSAVTQQTGFALTARYMLPFAVLMPLWAGELLCRRPALIRRAAPGLCFVVALGAATVHAAAWYTHARDVAGGADGTWLFVPHASWVPPLGWVTWIVVVGAAAGAYVIAGAMAARAILAADSDSVS